MNNDLSEYPKYALIRIIVRGDSMAPVYPDGHVVEFRQLPDGQFPVVGGHLLVIHRDGRTTFKRLTAIKAGGLLLTDRTGADHFIDLSDVARVAVLVGFISPVDGESGMFPESENL